MLNIGYIENIYIYRFYKIKNICPHPQRHLETKFIPVPSTST